jgi:hypothetical protein
MRQTSVAGEVPKRYGWLVRKASQPLGIVTFALAAIAGAAGCSNDSGLPKELWIAPLHTEADLQLLDHQPDPF